MEQRPMGAPPEETTPNPEMPTEEKRGRGRPPKKTEATVALRVLHGTFYNKGKYYGPGETFDCPANTAEEMLEQGDVEKA